jgi:hypothetical protein
VTRPKDKDVPEDPGLLHVYGQGGYHDDVFLVGNTRGLKAARDIIDRVLEEDAAQDSGWVSVCDGEGYDLKVMRVDDPWSMNFEVGEAGEVECWRPGAPPGSRWARIAYPYTDEKWGREQREDALWPSKFWKYPYRMPPLTVTVAEYLGDAALDAPLVAEGDEVDCPYCSGRHPTSVVDGMEGERLLVFRCRETRGENELIAGFSDGELFRLVVSLLNRYE